MEEMDYYQLDKRRRLNVFNITFRTFWLYISFILYFTHLWKKANLHIRYLEYVCCFKQLLNLRSLSFDVRIQFTSGIFLRQHLWIENKLTIYCTNTFFNGFDTQFMKHWDFTLWNFKAKYIKIITHYIGIITHYIGMQWLSDSHLSKQEKNVASNIKTGSKRRWFSYLTN